MGYHTEFTGSFSLNRPLQPEHLVYLLRFSDKRHVKMDYEKIRTLPDPIREAVGLPLGVQGEYYIGLEPHEPVSFDEMIWTLKNKSPEKLMERFEIPNALDQNEPPFTQPGLWCAWEPSPDGTRIRWSGAEKFYKYVEWLQYLIRNFLEPWDYSISGKVRWQGEEDDDKGVIIARNNEVTVYDGSTFIDTGTDARPMRAFLCHASGDKPKVRKLYGRLVQDGVNPWLDEVSLLPGQDWEYEIRNALRQSDVVLVCLTPQSVTKAGFVQREIKQSLDLADEQPAGSVYIIPVRLQECEVPDRLKRWQWVDLFKRGGYDRLLQALEVRAQSLSL